MCNRKIREDIKWMPEKGYINMPEGAEVCEISKETYYEMFECMPPLIFSADWFACMEPHSHVWNGTRYAPTFSTFTKVEAPDKTRYFYLGALTAEQIHDIHKIISKNIYDDI